VVADAETAVLAEVEVAFGIVIRGVEGFAILLPDEHMLPDAAMVTVSFGIMVVNTWQMCVLRCWSSAVLWSDRGPAEGGADWRMA
jgi:hypothetical protein